MIPPSSGVVGSSLNTGIQLRTGPHKGRLVMCMRRICKGSCPGPWQSFAAYSDDSSKTWRVSPFLEEGSTECQVAELSNGDVYMSIRPYRELLARSNGTRASALSTDGGSSFSAVEFEPQLLNAGGVDGSVVTPGRPSRTVFFTHPDHIYQRGTYPGGRSNLTLYKSMDDAQTWTPALDVYTKGAAYSSMAMLEMAHDKSSTHSVRNNTSRSRGRCKVGVLFEKGVGYKTVPFVAFIAISTVC